MKRKAIVELHVFKDPTEERFAFNIYKVGATIPLSFFPSNYSLVAF